MTNNFSQPNELKYVLLPGKLLSGAAPQSIYYGAAFDLWKSVWTETLKELDGTTQIFSDEFTSQDVVGAIFKGSECLSLSLFRLVDLSAKASRCDSYFKVWPEPALRKLCDYGNQIMVGSNITAAPTFRGMQEGVSAKDLLMGLLVRRFLETPADAMTGTMRNNRSMQDCAYRHGASLIQPGLIHHGVEVDLVGFFRNKMKKTLDPELESLIEKMWARRIQFSPEYSKNPRKSA